MSIAIFLLSKLAENHADLVRDVADGVVARLLAPLRELGRNGDALTAGRLVGGDEVVLRFDESEQLSRKLWLHIATEGVEGEAPLAASSPGSGPGLAGLVGADGECSVPGGTSVSCAVVLVGREES